MIAWVTRHALTTGIEFVEGDRHGAGGFLYKHGECVRYLRSGEWYESEREAVDRAEQLRAWKISSLKKKIARLEKMEFRCVKIESM
jgi:hypothetical protein